ncbi:pR298L [African swine fever virus]|uniref:PR298L n=1 Tax=African swine fever virus TaxID=10497 RepID=A0A8A1V7I5_ASF|nr:pR298L [African swine fever virus]
MSNNIFILYSYFRNTLYFFFMPFIPRMRHKTLTGKPLIFIICYTIRVILLSRLCNVLGNIFFPFQDIIYIQIFCTKSTKVIRDHTYRPHSYRKLVLLSILLQFWTHVFPCSKHIILGTGFVYSISASKVNVLYVLLVYVYIMVLILIIPMDTALLIYVLYITNMLEYYFFGLGFLKFFTVLLLQYVNTIWNIFYVYYMLHTIFGIFDMLIITGSILYGFQHDVFISWNFFFTNVLIYIGLPYLLSQKDVISTTLKHTSRRNAIHVLRCGDPFHLCCTIYRILCLWVFYHFYALLFRPG